MINTPPPWHFDSNRDEITVYADNDWPVARVLEHGDKHNARLIAAAPDMLAALKALISVGTDFEGMTFSERMCMAIDAIARATGQNDDRTDGKHEGTPS